MPPHAWAVSLPELLSIWVCIGAPAALPASAVKRLTSDGVSFGQYTLSSDIYPRLLEYLSVFETMTSTFATLELKGMLIHPVSLVSAASN
jgi:hypothetical protein